MGSDAFDLTGKNAAVTGGAMGIGYGIVTRFVEAGANVVVVDIDDRAGESAVAELAGPGKAVFLHADVSDVEAGDAIVDECVRQFGSLDILVNNAGIYPNVPMLEMTTEAFDRVIAINLRGLALCSKAAGRRMREQGTGGVILNIASIDSLHPSMVGLAAYDSSKGGMLMFTKSFALEMAPYGVRVNAIAPGGVATEGTARPLEGSGMTPAEMDALMSEFAAKVPLGRMGAPHEIAWPALFLASDAASYVTGEVLVVDGGRLLS